jgi:GTP-binding protein
MPAKFLKSAIRAADIPKTTRPQIAMVGRSNVGKSSLINHLAGVKGLAKSSASAGLTQTINLYEMDSRYLLVDLPGYGYSRKQRSQGRGFEDMIGDYLSNAALLRLVLLIIDGRHGFTENDRHAYEQLAGQKIPFAIIFNKIDKVSNSAAAVSMRLIQAEHPDVKCIPHSINSPKGLGEIRDLIERAVRSEASKKRT